MKNCYLQTVSILLLMSCLSMPPANLQATEKKDMLSLSGAISMSLMGNTQYINARLKMEEAKEKVIESWGGLWPSLSSSVSAQPQGADRGMNTYSDGNYNITFISGSWNLNPGAFYHSLQASRKSYISATHELRKVKAETTINAIRAYYQVLLAEETIRLTEESVKSLAQNFRTVSIGYRKGTFSRLDYLRARVSLSNERVKLINAKNNVMTARASLNMILGRDIDEYMNIDTRLRNVKDQELAYADLSPEEEKRTMSGMVAQALKNRPELIQIKLTKQIQDHTGGIARSTFFWPTFSISGNWGMTQSINPTTSPFYSAYVNTDWNKSWSVTFAATYTWGELFPFSKTWAKSRQADLQAKQTANQLKEFIRSLKMEVQSAFLKLKSASLSLKAQKGNIASAEESMRVSYVQFRNGIIDNTKLLEANVALQTARNLYIQALHDYQVARAELNRSIGVDIFSIE